MHKIQEKVLSLLEEKELKNFTLRGVGSEIGEKSPQKIKHHLSQLEKKGFIVIDTKNKIVRKARPVKATGIFVSLPIYGSADCGPRTIFAENNIEGFLKVSKKLVHFKKELFVVRANGNSMNKANLHGKNIENGDFVLVDGSKTNPESGDYVVSVLDDMANIKKIVFDKQNKRIVLKSESTQDYLPIFIHEDDSLVISGTVVDVIKKSNA
jgi:repressor LexA